ncbi:MAG TPA: helix-turn-helix domain-containing protein [Nocardioidaceae bacterium]|nr:helix-turn-helix domain-containing protein [Nocardioidaceae bacterium]
MTSHPYATLDPVDPEVRTEAHRLAARLAKGPDKDTEVTRVVRSMLAGIAQGERLVVLRADDEVTPAQAAEILGVTRQYVDRLLADEVLAFHRLPGSKHRRIRVRDVLALAAEREQRQAGHTALRAAVEDAGLLDDA